MAAEAMTDALAAKLMRRAAIAALSVAGFLIALKAVAFLGTQSVSMLASLADSGLDFVASLLNFIAIRHALTPADAEHRFGHGKAEPLSGLAQAAFIAGSAGFLLIESINRLIDPERVSHGGAGIAVMVFSIAVTLVLVLYQRHVVKRTGSIAVSSDGMHYVSDLGVNAGVIVGLVLATWFGLPQADAVVAIIIALVLGVTAWIVFRPSIDQLMDRELDDAQRDAIKAIVLAHPDVRKMRDLRTRAAGRDIFIQFHADLDRDTSLAHADRVSDAIEAAIQKSFPNAEIIIRLDTVGGSSE